MITVKATREGRLGFRTSSGYRAERNVPFVALPSTAALHLWVSVVNPRTHLRIRALVLDVGPWNMNDHAYVFGHARPQAESGLDQFGRKTNGAGIDLSEAVWTGLQMHDNDTVQWEFV